MAQMGSGAVVQQIGAIFQGASVSCMTDRELLDRYIARHDAISEAAFAALVTRHGPMVLDLCRQIVGDRHLAEDSFQAVFFVLACKARSIRDSDLLANWLYGVSVRTARNAKCRLARQRKNEGGGSMRRPGPSSGASIMVESTVPPGERSVLAREQAEALHSEIDRLPRSFRMPVVLLLLRGTDTRRSGAAASMAGRHAPQPVGPGARQAAPWVDAPRHRVAGCRHGRGGLLSVSLGSRLIPPVRYHYQCRGSVRGRTCCG